MYLCNMHSLIGVYNKPVTSINFKSQYLSQLRIETDILNYILNGKNDILNYILNVIKIKCALSIAMFCLLDNREG